jgi:hypothetical protein
MFSRSPTNGTKAARLGRLDGEAGVVLGPVNVAQPGVRRFDVVDPGQPQRLGQPALERAEHPLHPPPPRASGE